MTTLLRMELQKLRTTRIAWAVLAASQLIVIAGVSGLVVSGANLRDAQTPSRAIAHVGLASLCALVLGIYAVAGEYRFRTIADTYLTTPRRGRVLAAKLAVFGGAGVLLGVTAGVTALVATKVWWTIKGVPLDLGASDIWRTALGGVAWNALFAAIGVALGALLRSLAAAIAAALAWIALVEGIVGQLVGARVREWLPFAAGQSLGRAVIGGDHQLPQWSAALLLAGYATLAAAVAASITLRRDVT